MRLVILISALALSACATRQELAAEYAHHAPAQLCVRASLAGNHVARQAAWDVIAARRIDCGQYAGLIAAQSRADSAAMNQSLMLMNAGRAQPAMQPSAQASCRSFNRGTYIQTVCD